MERYRVRAVVIRVADLLVSQDFDSRVTEYLMKQYKEKTGRDARQDKRSVQKLRRKVEDAKKSLSTQHQVDIEASGQRFCAVLVVCLSHRPLVAQIDAFHEGQDFKWKLTRAKFDELNIDLFKKTLDPVRNVLSDAKLKKTDINEIVLVGGSTRIPKVQQLLRDFFDGKEPSRGE